MGYAQQQNLHLATSTVREALEFSALLRQPKKFSRAEKLAYVDEVIATLDMVQFADAIIGVPGEGLNIEQRKRVTIGVELAARPELLLFLDEPTSGLDSDTAWSICTLLRKLANNGQAILCTIHQPSSNLFEMFDRLLFLAEGESIYFGDIGKDAKVFTSCFEKHGARKCASEENPAEWLLEITGGTSQSGDTIDWYKEWRSSDERHMIDQSLEQMKAALSGPMPHAEKHSAASKEFAISFISQLLVVTRRNLIHDWRTPSYLYSKAFLTIGAVRFWVTHISIEN